MGHDKVPVTSIGYLVMSKICSLFQNERSLNMTASVHTTSKGCHAWVVISADMKVLISIKKYFEPILFLYNFYGISENKCWIFSGSQI
jgi:hypothetical protein